MVHVILSSFFLNTVIFISNISIAKQRIKILSITFITTYNINRFTTKFRALAVQLATHGHTNIFLYYNRSGPSKVFYKCPIFIKRLTHVSKKKIRKSIVYNKSAFITTHPCHSQPLSNQLPRNYDTNEDWQVHAYFPTFVMSTRFWATFPEELTVRLYRKIYNCIPLLCQCWNYLSGVRM